MRLAEEIFQEVLRLKALYHVFRIILGLRHNS